MIELNRRDFGQPTNLHAGYIGKEKSAWVTIASWDKLFIVLAAFSLLLAIAALFVLLTPLLNFVLNFMSLHFAAWGAWQEWIMDGELGLIIVAALGLSALLFALIARYRLRRNYSVYVEAGCPQCRENDLIRVRRNRRDRFLSFLGLPVRRYSCRNCTWHGLRFSGYRYRKNNRKIEEPIDGQFVDEMREIQLEFGEENVAAADMLITAAVETDLQAFNRSVDPVTEEEPVELMVQAPETSVGAAHKWSSYDEGFATLVQTAENETVDMIEPDDASPFNEQIDENETVDTIELDGSGAFEEQIDENEASDMIEPDDADSFDEQIDEELEQELVDEEELPADYQETDGDKDAGLDPAIEEDDFDRLCHEVALAKK